MDRASDPKRVTGGVGSSILSGVKSYLGNIGQNVRDVGTAAGTNIQIGRFGGADAMQGKPLDVAGTNNFAKQTKEVFGSIIGRPGTRSDEFTKAGGYKSMGPSK